MITKDQLFVGRKLIDPYRTSGSNLLIVTQITEKGFKYVWVERMYGINYGWSDGGEMFEIAFLWLEVAHADQKPY